ncbi:hypothetical protein POM88_041353 [Heracleum sosnowskyi]|uniref:Glutamate-1-semialdehyde aminotransferase n=1 Tax=Heracleum sosnowskyi TaxID=360622 RepID=A0AAD8MAN3_9APIA|nr:hypothetical protein POM88_041353 [Heracleum sosnowskyi]
MPGGVNSPVRAFKSVGGQPIVIDSVKGYHMWDINGNEYIDYVGSWGPAIIGHADDEEMIKKKPNSSEGVDGIEELVSGGKKSHGPGWLIGRHGSSLIKTSTQAPPQTDS